MKMHLTKYGLPQVWFYPAVVVLIMIIWAYIPQPGWLCGIVELLLLAVLLWMLSFFRDPVRQVPQDTDILLSPADGTVADITCVHEPDFIGGPALRIGIFLSVFNVHINRVPCKVRIEKVTYKKGMFKDARDASASKVNESNDIAMTRLGSSQDKLVVRQISGAIARHIVCKTAPGEVLEQGQQFGMIKFGSRTELYLPAVDRAKCQVSLGDKVQAGLTVLVRYET